LVPEGQNLKLKEKFHRTKKSLNLQQKGDISVQKMRKVLKRPKKLRSRFVSGYKKLEE